MDGVVARCPACGNVEPNAFTKCVVCGSEESRWWCQACHMWLATRACPACGGGVVVPDELALGTCIVGDSVRFAVKVVNRGRKLLSCTVSSPDPAVSILGPRLLVPATGSVEVRGSVTVPPDATGRLTFTLRFDAPVPAETILVVDAVAALPRIEFQPAAISITTSKPGNFARQTVRLANTGNVVLSAKLTCSEKWLAVAPQRVGLAPGDTATVELTAKSKRTDFGTREAKLVAEADGRTWETTVRHALPAPQLAAEPVAFGELRPGHPAFAEVTLRNTGYVRVQCTLSAAHPWLQVRPTRVNLPPGRVKKVRARAALTSAHDGPQQSELVLTSTAGVVLRVPVTAIGKVPKPVLRAIRKQTVRDAIGPPVERKFTLANDGDGRLICTATADKPWVRIVTPELRVAPGKRRKLRYVLELPLLPRGEHKATITLSTNAGTTAVPVTVHVLDPNPVLEVVPGPDLGTITPDVPLSAFVRVRNAGVGLLTACAVSENPHVTVTPTTADVPTGPPVKFHLAVPVAGLTDGDHTVAVRFTSNGGDGRAVLRFRLPVERIDAPALIDLGELPAGRLTGDALRVKNTGPDCVTLRVRGAHQWVRPAADRITVNPGELVAVPFRFDLPPGVLGPVMSALIIEGRALRREVAVRAVARKVELVAVPDVVMLGEMRPGEERPFTVDLKNAGEITMEVGAVHATGELEVWVQGAVIRPGERVRLSGRARVNTRLADRQLLAQLTLADEAPVRFVAQVLRPSVVPRVAAVTAAVSGVVAGAALSVGIAWWVGVPVALVGLATGAWLYWLDTR